MYKRIGNPTPYYNQFTREFPGQPAFENLAERPGSVLSLREQKARTLLQRLANSGWLLISQYPPPVSLLALEALSMLGEVLTDFSRCPSSKLIEAFQ